MVNPAEQPTGINKSLEFLASFEEKRSDNIFEDFVSESPDVPMEKLLERHIGVIQCATEDAYEHPEFAPAVSVEAIDKADEVLANYAKDTNQQKSAEMQKMLKSARATLKEARKVFSHKPKIDTRPGILARAGGVITNVGRQLSESVIGIFDKNHAKSRQAYNGIIRLNGPHREFPQEIMLEVYKIMREHPDVTKAMEEFIEVAEKAQVENIKLLNETGISVLLGERKMEQEVNDKWGNLMEEIIKCEIEVEEGIKRFLIDLRETTMPINSQILTDSPSMNLLNDHLNLRRLNHENVNSFKEKCFVGEKPGSATGVERGSIHDRALEQRVIAPDREAVGKLQTYMEECKESGSNPDPKVIKEIQDAYGYTDRNTSLLQEKADWQNRYYNQKGGLISAEKIVGYRLPNGMKRESIIKLDFSSISKELSKQQSLELFDLYVHLQNGISSIHPWLQSMHEAPNDPMDRQELMEAIDNNDQLDDATKKKFKLNANACLSTFDERLGNIEWLDFKQKGQAVRVLAAFTHQVNRALTENLMLLGR